MLKLKIAVTVTAVACIFLASGYIIYQNTHQNKNESVIKESELVVAEIDYNGFSRIGRLASIFQNKAVYYIIFIKSQSADGSKHIIYAEDRANNLSTSEISALFNLGKYIVTTNDTYTIYFSDKSHLTIVEFENLLGTIDSSGFSTFENSYRDNFLLDATDFFLTINLDGAAKTVHDYGDLAPDGFHQIKDVIRNVITTRWDITS